MYFLYKTLIGKMEVTIKTSLGDFIPTVQSYSGHDVPDLHTDLSFEIPDLPQKAMERASTAITNNLLGLVGARGAADKLRSV